MGYRVFELAVLRILYDENILRGGKIMRNLLYVLVRLTNSGAARRAELAAPQPLLSYRRHTYCFNTAMVSMSYLFFLY